MVLVILAVVVGLMGAFSIHFGNGRSSGFLILGILLLAAAVALLIAGFSGSSFGITHPRHTVLTSRSF